MNAGHFKLGLFVTVAFGLLIVFLLTLGVLDRFKPEFLAETYFNEPIAGLQAGAAVRFRGLRVGRVGRINFAGIEYPEARQREPSHLFTDYIRVVLILDPAYFAAIGVEDLEARVQKTVDAGLRVQLAARGLGGPTYIEADILDTQEFPAAAVPWTPIHPYIPSAPSTTGTIVRSLAAILRRVEGTAFLDDVSTITRDLRQLLSRLDESDGLAGVESALEELRLASRDARTLLTDPRLDALLDDATTTLRSAQTLLEGGEIEATLAEVTGMATALEGAAGSLEGLATTVADTGLIGKLDALATELGPLGHDLAGLTTRLQRVLRANEAPLADAIGALRDAALELEALLEELKANPGRLLADPPPRRPPDGR